MPVAKTALTTFQQFYLFTVVGHLTEKLASLGIKHDCATWHFYYLVFTILTETPASGARLSVAGKDVTLVFQR